jgi:hypothetical protein
MHVAHKNGREMENKEDEKKKEVTFGRTEHEREHKRNHLILKF